jgi:hypothetical protein
VKDLSTLLWLAFWDALFIGATVMGLKLMGDPAETSLAAMTPIDILTVVAAIATVITTAVTIMAGVGYLDRGKLTKRERLAAIAMQGLISSETTAIPGRRPTAVRAISFADALIAELARRDMSATDKPSP